MQARILLDLAGRLGRGEPPLPTDVMAPLLEELTARADEEAIAEAWALQGSEEATPWPSVRDRLLR